MAGGHCGKRGSWICWALEPVPRRELRLAHGACTDYLTKRWRAKGGINRGEMDGIENIGGGRSCLRTGLSG